MKRTPKIFGPGERARLWVSVEEIEAPTCPYCTRKVKATHVVVLVSWVSWRAGESRVKMCEAHAKEVASAIANEIRSAKETE